METLTEGNKGQNEETHLDPQNPTGRKQPGRAVQLQTRAAFLSFIKAVIVTVLGIGERVGRAKGELWILCL